MAFLLRPIPSGMLTNRQQKTSQGGPRMPFVVDGRVKGTYKAYLVGTAPRKDHEHRPEN
jgi:hypothetical protein